MPGSGIPRASRMSHEDSLLLINMLSSKADEKPRLYTVVPMASLARANVNVLPNARRCRVQNECAAVDLSRELIGTRAGERCWICGWSPDKSMDYSCIIQVVKRILLSFAPCSCV